MSINYYLYKKIKNKIFNIRCENHINGIKVWYIGKSSCGWAFTLHVSQNKNEFPIVGMLTLSTYIHDPDYFIKNEYGSIISPEEMFTIIKYRKGSISFNLLPPIGYKNWNNFYSQNNCIKDSHGLLRCNIGKFCIGHGSGTWDCCVGDFS